MIKHRVWKYRGTVLTLSFLLFFATFTLTYVKPMAQSMRTMREVYNFVYDEVNKRLMTTPWAGAQAVKYTETEILNFVYDPVCHCLKVSGGGTGGGDISVSGSPTTDQLMFWANSAPPYAAKGSSSINMNVTSLDVTGASLTAPNRSGTVTPATCAVLGETFYRTDTFVTYTCTATNTWTPLAGGGVAVGDSPTWTGTHTFNNNPKIPGFSDTGGTAYARLTSGYLQIGPTKLSFGATVAGGADLVLQRINAAHLKFGDSPTSSPAGLILSAQDATGTDRSGSTMSLQGSLGTGNASPGGIDLRAGAISAASGTTAQSPVSRSLNGATKVLTNNSATNLVSAQLVTGSAIGGVLEYTIEVTNGTDFQAETGRVLYAAVNKGGTVTATITEDSSTTQAVSSGTLATTWAISSANPSLISINANSSLTPSTGYPRITYSIRNMGQQSITPQ